MSEPPQEPIMTGLIVKDPGCWSTRGGCKLAICSMYMAAEVTANNDFVVWNDCLYSSIQGELKGFPADRVHVHCA